MEFSEATNTTTTTTTSAAATNTNTPTPTTTTTTTPSPPVAVGNSYYSTSPPPDHSNSNSNSNSPPIISPCAACKILRRRCADKCVLAPYFPPSDPAKFSIAHRVFGASNIIKFLQELPEGQRADAVSSMVYEASARIRDPVYGCAGAISQLQQQVNDLQAQLAKSQAQLLTMQAQQANLMAHILTMPVSTADTLIISSNNSTANCNTTLVPPPHPHPHCFQTQLQNLQHPNSTTSSCYFDDTTHLLLGPLWDPLWT